MNARKGGIRPCTACRRCPVRRHGVPMVLPAIMPPERSRHPIGAGRDGTGKRSSHRRAGRAPAGGGGTGGGVAAPVRASIGYRFPRGALVSMV
jgi:hypothetical protein